MDYRRAAVLLIILCALGATAAFAAPCQPGPLSSYLVGGGVSCTEGPFTIKSFVFSESMGGLDPTLITVIPTFTQNQLEFQVMGNFTAQNQTLTYVFSYFIDAPPIIHGQQDDLDPTGMVTLQTAICAVAFPCPGGQGLGTNTATTGQPTATKTLMMDLNALGLQNTLTINGNGGIATSGGFDNITILTTPEPAAILLMASGLLGLLAFRSRQKLRQVFLQLRS